MELLSYFGQWFRNVHEALNYVVEAWWWCEEEKIGYKQTKKWGGAKDFLGASVPPQKKNCQITVLEKYNTEAEIPYILLL